VQVSAETGSAIRTIGTVYGALLNDADALARMAPWFHDAPYKAPPVAPILYIKPRNTFAADGAAVAIPADPGQVRIEATVGAVIARTASRVDASQALGYIAGYVVVSDLTLPHDSVYRPAIRQRCRDGFCPMSHVIASSAFDLAVAEIVISINDVEAHRRSFARLVRNLPRLIEDVTAFMTLEAGDVLLVGPPDDAPLARADDTVRIDVAGLGSLMHRLVAEDEAA
jgi:5-oxopent-3-ene-1,2,5-tricarboxylate decarboxylase / 2-hydroxyhepta-2,4-diene-1,7-dioate isomerase